MPPLVLPITMKQGAAAGLPAGAPGEWLYVTDTRRMHYGTSGGNSRVLIDGDADAAGTAAGLMAAHLAAGDPHPQYLTAAEGAAAYDPLGSAAAAQAASQPLDATLTALAAANWAANALPVGSGADTLAQVTFGANTFPARASTGNLVARTVTDFGLSLVDDADAAAARTTLGLGTLATQSGTFSGTHSGTSSGTNTGDQTITLSGAVTGTGTGAIAATYGDMVSLSVLGRSSNTTGTPGAMAAGADGEVMRRNGTTIGFGTVATAGLADDAVTNAKAANMATATFKGRTTAGTGDPEDLSAAQAAALLPVFVAAGGSAAKGLVPAPGATAHPNQPYYPGDDGAWHARTGAVIGSSYVATSETTTSTTAADLATVQSLAFTLDESTDLVIFVNSGEQNNTVATNRLVINIDGTDTTIARAFNPNTAQNFCLAGVLKTTLAAGAHTVKLRFNVSSGTGTFFDRSITIWRA